MTFKFAYEEHKNGFLGWAVIMLLGKAREDGYDDIFDVISDRSNEFNDLELKIELNGIEMSADGFMERMREIMEHEAEKVAREKLSEVAEFIELEDDIADLRALIKKQKEKLAKKYDIAIGDEYF
jgi:hypothetical protein